MMGNNKFAGVLLLVATAIAVPTNPPLSPPISYTADFEEFNPNPAASLTLVPSPYNALGYENSAVAPNAPLVEPLSFTTPSGNNYAVSTIGPTNITRDYPSSRVDSFTVTSLLAGTYLNAGQGATAAAVDATIAFTGIQKSGKVITKNVKFEYKPSLLGVSTQAQQLRPVTLSGFKDLKSFALVVVEPSAVLPALIGTVADKIKYSVVFRTSA